MVLDGMKRDEKREYVDEHNRFGDAYLARDASGGSGRVSRVPFCGRDAKDGKAGNKGFLFEAV